MVLFMLGLWQNIQELKKTQLRPAWFIHVHLHNAAYRGHFNNNNKNIYIVGSIQYMVSVLQKAQILIWRYITSDILDLF